MIDIRPMVALIILACAVCKNVDHRTKGSLPEKAELRLMARMDELEGRLTDIQDVMIAIDEKMDRPKVEI